MILKALLEAYEIHTTSKTVQGDMPDLAIHVEALGFGDSGFTRNEALRASIPVFGKRILCKDGNA